MAHDVFVSYSTEDRATAFAACARLEKAAISCWIAPRDVGAGTYDRQIIDAISAARAFVLIFSSRANASNNVKSEVNRAFDANKIIIPFRIENIKPDEDMVYYLGRVNWFDAVDPPLERHLDRLVDQVRLILGKDSSVPPPVPAAEPKSDAVSPLKVIRANCIRGWESVGGKLSLYPEFLEFRPHAFNIQKTVLTLAYRNIVRVEPYSVSGFMPTGMAVTTRDGTTHRFIIFGRKPIIETLTPLIAR